MSSRLEKTTVDRPVMNCRFEEFEVRFSEWELRKRGVRVRLQRKPFQILKVLLERPGELVTRAELAAHLWPDLHVEYERSLNTAVNCLRQALGDSSRNCRFIETCPGLGYRFIGVLETFGGALPQPSQATSPETRARPASIAHAEYLKGLSLYSKMTVETLGRAGAYFEAAIRMDSKFAAPHAGLADVQNLLACWSVIPTRDAALRAKRHAEAALQIDASLAEAHCALATATRLLQEPSSDVEHRYRTALELSDACANTHVWYGDFLCAAGRFTEAIEHVREAQQLDPLSLFGNFQLAWVLYTARDFRSSLEQSWNTLMLEPGFAPAQYTLGLAHLQLGQMDEAVTEFENARRCSGDHPATLASIAHAHAKSGREDAASSALAELKSATGGRYISQYWLALVYAGLENYTEAAKCLDDASRSGDVLACWYSCDPRFDGLRLSLKARAV